MIGSSCPRALMSRASKVSSSSLQLLRDFCGLVSRRLNASSEREVNYGVDVKEHGKRLAVPSNVASKCLPARRKCLNLRDNVEETWIDHILLFTVNNPVTPVRRSGSGTPIDLGKKIVLKLLLRMPVFARPDAFDYSVELPK